VAAGTTAGLIVGAVATAAVIATKRMPDGTKPEDDTKDKGIFLGGK
jgi:hypothetical protein